MPSSYGCNYHLFSLSINLSLLSVNCLVYSKGMELRNGAKHLNAALGLGDWTNIPAIVFWGRLFGGDFLGRSLSFYFAN